jgi:tetratricopeptide (TPR) repeat protein
MNFLLHMIGQAHRETPTDFVRPTPRRMLLRRAALAAAGGRFADALALRQQLDNASTTNTLILAHLHLATRNFIAARDLFEQVLDLGVNDALEQQIEAADTHLRNGRYVRATNELQQGRTAIDTQLSAHAGLLLATTLPGSSFSIQHSTFNIPSSPLAALARLGDLLLRMLARTHLAANVAQSLRDRNLREDLAPWATTNQSVDHLLQAEFDSLQRTCAAQPDHAENNYRLGLVARALHNLEVAAQAFTRVLHIHPHHTLAASRLAATLLELDRSEAAMPLLASAYALPAETLAQYHQLAGAATDRRAFDRTVTTLCERFPFPTARATLKANLAFALGEMGLLDEERATWTEPAPIAEFTL